SRNLGANGLCAAVSPAVQAFRGVGARNAAWAQDPWKAVGDLAPHAALPFGAVVVAVQCEQHGAHTPSAERNRNGRSIEALDLQLDERGAGKLGWFGSDRVRCISRATCGRERALLFG